MNDVQLGRVVWANVVNSRGKPAGRHAAIILTAKSERPIIAVVISTKIHLGTMGAMVPIKQVLNRRGGHPQTGLTKSCAAMCDWIVELEADDIEEYRGLIYGSDLQEIMECVAANQKPNQPKP